MEGLSPRGKGTLIAKGDLFLSRKVGRDKKRELRRAFCQGMTFAEKSLFTRRKKGSVPGFVAQGRPAGWLLRVQRGKKGPIGKERGI